MKKAIMLLIVLITSAAYAAIYVTEDKNGGIQYTDTPSSNSSRVEIPAVNSISTPPRAAAPSQKANTNGSPSLDAAAVSTASSYQTLAIVSPTNESTIQNQPVIPVEMKVEPNILPGDKIQLMLDSKPVGTPTATQYQELGLVERGTHTLYAVILNSKNEVIKQSSAVTIHVRRNSIVPIPNSQRVNTN